MTDDQSSPAQDTPTRPPFKERVPEALFPLFSWGPPHDEERDEMFDYAAVAPDFQSHVGALVDVLLDEARWINAHGEPEVDEDDEVAMQELWGPYHALLLLRELKPPEAAEPLLALLDTEDDLLIEGLPDLYAAIGAPALPLLQSFVADEERPLHHRAYVIRIVGAIGEAHADCSDEVTTYLSELLQRESRDDSRDDEFLNGALIAALCDLHAEAVSESDERPQDNAVYQTIAAAFDAQCVDPNQVSREDVDIEFGVRPPWTDEEREQNLHKAQFQLTCLACDRDRLYDVTRVYYDIERDSGEGTFSGEGVEGDEYGPLYIPDTITCPKCGAVDQYKASPRGLQNIGVHAMMMSMNIQDETTESSPIRFVSFDGMGFGGHPVEAEARYRQQLASKPTHREFFLEYGRLLLFMKRPDLAAHQFAQAILLDPDSAEGYYHLAYIAEHDDDLEQALYFWEKARVAADLDKKLPRQRKRDILKAANMRLSIVNAPSGEAKVKPNAPCPCGSGKKYKKCCMR